MTKPNPISPRPFLLLFFALPTLTAWPAAGSKAPIQSVIVYLDRAQVTRVQQADCASGEVSFPGLPATLDAKSLWAEVPGQPGAVVGVTATEEASGARPEAAALEQQLRQLEQQLAALQASEQGKQLLERKLAALGSLLDSVWSWEATTAKPPIATWDAALDLLRQQALQGAQRQRRAQAERRELARQRSLLGQQLAALQQKQSRTTLRATALLRCNGRQPVSLSYVVPNATWTVSYRARIARSGQVTLETLALIAQGTGEDWKDVALAVSTANLQRQNVPPSVSPLRVSSYESPDERHVLTRRLEHRRHLTAGSPLGGSGGGQPAQEEPGLALELTTPGRASVPSDGQQVLVSLTKRTVVTRQQLETVPKLYPFVYRRLELKNPFSFPMLPGTVELYRDGSYVGRTSTELRAPGESLALSLGVNQQVQVDRYVKAEKLEGPGALGSSKTLVHRYAIQVGNWTRQRQRVQVKENLPVSRLKEVKVTLTADCTKPTQHNREDGILSWELTLAPRSKKTIVVDYRIEVPEDYVVQGY